MSIEFRDVSKVYPDGTVAVRDLSLRLPSRQLTVLLGSSGCGKTTLLRMVNRMVEPSSGTVLIDDEDVRQRDPVALRRGIGYVLQDGGLMPHRTVVDNVATVLVLCGQGRKAAREAALPLLDTVGLDRALATRYPAQLSGGQRQRVGVARALAADPNILLMDEPFGAVDPLVRRELQDELLHLHETLEKTILFITHDVDEAFRLGEHVVLLAEHAQIAQQGPPRELVENPASSFVERFVEAGRGTRTLREARTR